MNLEYLEEQCVKYLAQTTNPLVPLDALLAFLQRDPQCAEITQRELLAFLGEHEMFNIMDPLPVSDAETASELAELGISPAPRVILRRRIPTRAELTGLIERQLMSMTEAIQRARDEATANGSTDAIEKADQILERLDALHEAMRKVL